MSSMRKCTLCPSHLYDYCNKCKPKSEVEPWRLSFDSETCRDVYHILAEFAFGRKTAMDARKELENYNVPDKELMTSSLKKNYENIYIQTDAIYKEIEKQKKEQEEIIKEEPSLFEEESVEEVKPRRRRYIRRKYKDD